MKNIGYGFPVRIGYDFDPSAQRFLANAKPFNDEPFSIRHNLPFAAWIQE
jgi:hypothetical protein